MSRADLGERWQRVFDDTEATAAEYRDRGWEALALHPGDVNPIADEAAPRPAPRLGVRRGQRTALWGADRVDSGVCGGGETASYRLVVAENATAEVAVCVPTFVLDSDNEALEAAATDAGELVIRLRPLDDRDHVEFAVDDPSLFFQDPAE